MREVREEASGAAEGDVDPQADGDDEDPGVLPLAKEAEAHKRRVSVLSQDGASSTPFRQRVEEALGSGGAEGGGAGFLEGGSSLQNLLALGPRNVGPNMLLRKKGLRVRLLTVEKREAAGGEDGQQPDVVEKEVLAGDEDLESLVWRCLENSITTGFQMATVSGESCLWARGGFGGRCFATHRCGGCRN